MSDIYGESSMLSGIHELLHLVNDYRNISLTNENCLFPYEDLNGFKW